MIKENIQIFNTSDELSENFTKFLQNLLSVYPHINISLSGGSTPKQLFNYWSQNNKQNLKLDWGRISFYWGDERCVPPDNEMSNYGMTEKHLFKNIHQIQTQNIHRIQGENDPTIEAQRYAKLLNSNLAVYKNTPCFELILLGMGDDGHTASIFPDQMNLWNSENDCVVAKHPETGMQRISLSGKVINNAQHVAFLVTGKDKAEKVSEIIKNRSASETLYPAAKVNPSNGFLYWFLDKESAKLL